MMYPEKYPVTSEKYCSVLAYVSCLISYFANTVARTVPYPLRKVCSSTCVGPS